MATESRVFIDTAPFIYLIEDDGEYPEYYYKVENFLINCIKNKCEFYTSVITEEEYFVHPYRKGRLDFIESFKRLKLLLGIEVVNIDEEIAELAAKIRAEYKSFKSMDALQLACAMKNNCDCFLTNDKQLLQFKEMNVLLLDNI